jgi:protein TonB
MPPQVPSAAVAHTTGDRGNKRLNPPPVQTAALEAPGLAPLDWAPPAAETPARGSDAIFTSERFEHFGESGAEGEGAPHEPTLEELAAAPTYTPFTRAAELENREEIRIYLLGRYPRQLQDARIGGRTMLWILVDEKGRARKAVLLRSSGYASLDDAALESTDLMRFAPAWNSGHVVPVWVQLPVNFRVE